MSKMTIRKTQSNMCFQIDICVYTMVVCEQFAWNYTQRKLNQLGRYSHSQHTQVYTATHTHRQSTHRFQNIFHHLITLRHSEAAAHNSLRRTNYKQLSHRKSQTCCGVRHPPLRPLSIDWTCNLIPPKCFRMIQVTWELHNDVFCPLVVTSVK
jgi:hypothetical protein